MFLFISTRSYRLKKPVVVFNEVSIFRWRKTDIVEACIKIKKNYSGFISTTINISDAKGDPFLIHLVASTEEDACSEEISRIHGTFTKDDACRSFWWIQSWATTTSLHKKCDNFPQAIINSITLHRQSINSTPAPPSKIAMIKCSNYNVSLLFTIQIKN